MEIAIEAASSKGYLNNQMKNNNLIWEEIFENIYQQSKDQSFSFFLLSVTQPENTTRYRSKCNVPDVVLLSHS